MPKAILGVPAGVRGMPDRLRDTVVGHKRVIETILGVARRYDFEDFDTPLLERREVFSRPLGDASDIVMKEMYGLEDRKGDRLVLRPEFTAGIMRAVLNGKLLGQVPLRYCYSGAVFRYERPQEGRLRQFHQVGLEIIGDGSVEADVVCVASAAAALRELEGDYINSSMKLKLRLNTLGAAEDRKAYAEALATYLSPKAQQLSEASRERLERNPLRILDSKDSGDQELLRGAPVIGDYLGEETQKRFNDLKGHLADLGIEFTHDERLVRGLDYYGGMVFEVESGLLGAKSVVLAGGRYDGLARMLGSGRGIAGVGWSAGVERLGLCCELSGDIYTAGGMKARAVVAVIPLTDDEVFYAIKVAEVIRTAGTRVKILRPGSFKKRLGQVSQRGCAVAVLLGGDEREQGVAKVKDLLSGEEETCEWREVMSTGVLAKGAGARS